MRNPGIKYMHNISIIIIFLLVFSLNIMISAQETAETEELFTITDPVDETDMFFDDGLDGIQITTFEETVEPALGSGSWTSWPALAIGGKIGFTIGGMFADSGLVQMPSFLGEDEEGIDLYVSDMKTGIKAFLCYGIYGYTTIVEMVQVQAEFWFSVYKGMNYNASICQVDTGESATSCILAEDYENEFSQVLNDTYPIHIQLLYFQIPILFRFEPDFYKWFDGQKYLDFYFLAGFSLNFLESVGEKMFRIDQCEAAEAAGETCDVEEAERYITPESYFSDNIGVFDVGFVFAVGYTLKGLVPVVDPVFEIRTEFGLLDLNDLSAMGTGSESSARNWTLYVTVGANWDLSTVFEIFKGPLF